MFAFGERSKKSLSTCDHRLVMLAERVIKVFDFVVLEGHRDEATQNEMFRKGVSKLKWPDGKHNRKPSLAFDLAPYPLDWTNKPKAVARFYLLAGLVMMAAWDLGLKIRWGGNWKMDWNLEDNSFDDLGHFEIIEDTP